MNAYIHADCLHGIRKMDENEAKLRGFVIDHCDDYDDVTYFLKKMGDGHDQVFERVLEVPEEVVPLIHEQFGISNWNE